MDKYNFPKEPGRFTIVETKEPTKVKHIKSVEITNQERNKKMTRAEQNKIKKLEAKVKELEAQVVALEHTNKEWERINTRQHNRSKRQVKSLLTALETVCIDY